MVKFASYCGIGFSNPLMVAKPFRYKNNKWFFVFSKKTPDIGVAYLQLISELFYP
jgi:hypothetical protein